MPNIPSLLSIPYFGYSPRRHRCIWRPASSRFSTANPYFFRGKYAQGNRQSHTPPRLRLAARAVRAGAPRRPTTRRSIGLRSIAASDVGDHRLHESFNANWPESVHARGFRLAERALRTARPGAARSGVRPALTPREPLKKSRTSRPRSFPPDPSSLRRSQCYGIAPSSSRPDEKSSRALWYATSSEAPSCADVPAGPCGARSRARRPFGSRPAVRPSASSGCWPKRSERGMPLHEGVLQHRFERGWAGR